MSTFPSHDSMALTGASIRLAVVKQTERTKNGSKADIEQLESSITSPESQIRPLIDLRDSQPADVLALRHIISPIRTLPVELLTEVFDFAIADRTHIKDAYRITHICTDWRKVAYSAPRLWSRPLQVDLRKKEDAGGYKAWLARSVPLPLPISLVPGYPINTDILAEVLKTATRWCSLRVCISGVAPPPWFIRQLSQCKFDSLEELHLAIIDDDGDPTPVSFPVVPRLRKLSVLSLLTAPQTFVPWAQLTDLTFQIDAHEGVLSILTQCTNLVEVSITTLPWSELPRAKDDIVVLGRLHTLSFTFNDPMTGSVHHSPPIFDYLSTPLLQVLRLESDGKYWTLPISAPFSCALRISPAWNSPRGH
ncbi:hypothetical protein C8R45DRAFT_1041782 [Mycena sanguinolenta]|nr:hypothetical protein C8R45DRAFT_1041782 [Mycena sanguinolenta]